MSVKRLQWEHSLTKSMGGKMHPKLTFWKLKEGDDYAMELDMDDGRCATIKLTPKDMDQLFEQICELYNLERNRIVVNVKELD